MVAHDKILEVHFFPDDGVKQGCNLPLFIKSAQEKEELPLHQGVQVGTVHPVPDAVGQHFEERCQRVVYPSGCEVIFNVVAYT